MRSVALALAATVALTAPAGASARARGRGSLSLTAGRAAIARYASNLRDAVAGARPGAPMGTQVEACRKRGGVVTCLASWTFAEVRCSVQVGAVAFHGVLVEELGEATCARPVPPPQPEA